MRLCNISSIGSAKSVREVILSWGLNSSYGRAALAALLGTAAATSAAASVLVVRSTGPSAAAYPAGRSLPDNARLNLRAGDAVIVLGAGGTRTFRGPGVFSPSSAVQAGTRTFAAADGRRARIGAVRSAGIVPHGPTIWHVDVTQSGTFCLARASHVMLWRPDATVPVTLTISGAGGAPRTVRWAAGQATIAWPAAIPIANGASFNIAQSGVAVPTQVTFRTLGREPADLEGVASALIANGCQGQLDVLVESQPDQSGGG
jgi:hypothetical protein